MAHIIYLILKTYTTYSFDDKIFAIDGYNNYYGQGQQPYPQQQQAQQDQQQKQPVKPGTTKVFEYFCTCMYVFKHTTSVPFGFFNIIAFAPRHNPLLKYQDFPTKIQVNLKRVIWHHQIRIRT